ncbi:MAG TPA: carbohydrate-binding protein, partial [Thermoanaerobaculia bacterium]
MRTTSRWCFALLLLLTIPLAAQTNTPYLGVIPPIPGTVEAEKFDDGGQNVAWFDTSPGNAFGAVYRSTDVDIGQISPGAYHVGALEAGEWLEYTVNVGATGTYNIVARYASAYTGTTTFNMTLDGVPVFSTNQIIVSTGSWSTFSTRSFTGNLNQGQHVLRVNFVQGFWNPDSFTFTAISTTCPTPTVSLPAKTGSAGGALDWTVNVSNATSVQWYRDGVAIVNDAVYFKGSNTTTLQLLKIEQGRHGGTYSVIATNACP